MLKYSEQIISVTIKTKEHSVNQFFILMKLLFLWSKTNSIYFAVAYQPLSLINSQVVLIFSCVNIKFYAKIP